MIYQGFAPTIFGDLADMTGRRPLYIPGFIVYIGACVGLALQNNYAALLALRCVQSAGSSGTVAIGSGVVGDIASSGERGKFLGALKSLMSKAYIDSFRHCSIWRNGSPCSWRHPDRISWLEMDLLVLNDLSRSVSHTSCYHFSRNWPQRRWQWLNTTSGLEHVPSQVPEARKIDHNETLSRTQSREDKKAAQAELASKRKLQWPNPLKTVHIILEKDAGMILLYNSLIYTAFYDIMATIPSLFADIYGFNDLQIGYAVLSHHLSLLLIAHQVGFHPLGRRRLYSVNFVWASYGREL